MNKCDNFSRLMGGLFYISKRQRELTRPRFFEIIFTEKQQRQKNKKEHRQLTEMWVTTGKPDVISFLSTVWAASFTKRNATVLFCFCRTGFQLCKMFHIYNSDDVVFIVLFRLI